MHATTANKEMCAYKQCCQPVETFVSHEGISIGYCHPHAVRVLGYDPKEDRRAP